MTEELGKYSFRPREGLDGDSLIEAARKLSRYAARLGFVLETPIDAVTPDEELENHYQETYPPNSRESFIAKEHFWKIGEELGIDRRESGAVFTRLIYPLRARTTYGQAEDIVDPKIRLGLVIKTRSEVGMPLPPPKLNIKGGSTTKAQFMHKEHRHGLKIPPQDVVVQVGSIIDIAESPALLSLVVISNDELRNLAHIGLRLEALVESR